MKGDRLRCRGCGRYRSWSVSIDDDEFFDTDRTDDATVDTDPCPTDGCDTTTATLAG